MLEQIKTQMYKIVIYFYLITKRCFLVLLLFYNRSVCSVNALLTLQPPPTRDVFYDQGIYGLLEGFKKSKSSKYVRRTVVEQELFTDGFKDDCNVNEIF